MESASVIAELGRRRRAGAHVRCGQPPQGLYAHTAEATPEPSIGSGAKRTHAVDLAAQMNRPAPKIRQTRVVSSV